MAIVSHHGQKHILTLPPVAGAALHMDGCLDLSQAIFRSDGADLLISAGGGERRVKDYYRADTKPTLVDDNGFALTESMVASMVREAFHTGTFMPFRPFAAEVGLAQALKEERTSQPVETDAPRILRILSGDTATLTPTLLALPSDTVAEEFILVLQGRHGFLTADDLVLRPGDRFAYAELKEGRVIYYHDESSSSQDTFQLKAANGDAPSIEICVQIAQ